MPENRGTILVVDDTPANLQLLESILQEKGYQVRAAISGQMALKAVRHQPPDIILLDINMPEMNGFEVCRALKGDQQHAGIPVIFVSAAVDTADKLHAFEEGGVDYVTKPFQPLEVLARVETHLALARAKITLERQNSALEQALLERTRMQEQLLEAKERAEAADRIKSAFLATMSHELRTPLNSIIGFTGLLLQELAGPLNAEQAKQLGMVKNSAQHLLSLISDVLDISKIEAGQLTVVAEPFNLTEVIRSVVQTVRPLAEKKGLQLALELADDPVSITGDQRRVEQVLLNLLSNAVKFTEQGTVKVTSVREGNSCLTTVTDTGIGIQPEDLPALFRPFHQIDTGLSRRYEGTGLGLSICKKLVELMGGTILVESIPGAGSCFGFTLPVEGAAA
ncbi:response regulator [Trichlorobacter lovleyi]|uniref:ATP-binding response regulator n=1 Tax=Trichlorobacter lovleyi TaxID=313985 RepID=UPI002240C794|nr:response regulator [Trichlorobacter lovleyi]QOX77390.1 response regulator [Trichlorobacter lovleyi]